MLINHEGPKSKVLLKVQNTSLVIHKSIWFASFTFTYLHLLFTYLVTYYFGLKFEFFSVNQD